MVQVVVRWGRDRWGRDIWRVRGSNGGGKGETSYNPRVCSGVWRLLWVGYWGTVSNSNLLPKFVLTTH